MEPTSKDSEPVIGEQKETTNFIVVLKDILAKCLSFPTNYLSICKDNIQNMQLIIRNAFKEVEKEKTLKHELEKETAKLETKMQIENRDRARITEQIFTMRTISTDIGDLLLNLHETLETIIKSAETVSFLLNRQKNNTQETLACLTTYCNYLKSKVKNTEDEISRQREQHINHILIINENISSLQEKEKDYQHMLNCHIDLTNELSHKNVSLAKDIVQLEKFYLDLKNKICDKEECHNKLLLELKKDQELFKTITDETTSNLLDIQNKIFMEESYLKTLEEEIRNRNDCNEKLLCEMEWTANCINVSKKEIKVSKENVNKMESDIQEAENELLMNQNRQIDEVVKLSIMCEDEQTHLDQTEMKIIDLTDHYSHLSKQNQETELQIERAHEYKSKRLKETESKEQNCETLFFHHQRLTKELNKSNASFRIWEKQESEIIEKKRTELTICNAQFENIQTQEEEYKKSIVQERNKIKRQYEVRKLKLAKQEKVRLEKEISQKSATLNIQQTKLRKPSQRLKNKYDKCKCNEHKRI